MRRLLTLAVLLLGAGFVFSIRDDLLAVKIQNPSYAFLLVTGVLCFLLMNGLQQKWFLKIYGIELSTQEWFGLSIINTLGNLVTPVRGGTVTGALYLKNRYNFLYSEFLASLAATYVIVFWVNSFMGLLSLTGLRFFTGHRSDFLTLFFVGSLLFFSAIICFTPTLPPSKHAFINRFAEPINAWPKLRRRVDILILTALVTLLNLFFVAMMNFAEFKMLGLEATPLQCLVIAVFSSFSLFLSITPGGLGIREAFVVVSGKVVGMPTAGLFAASLLERGSMFLVSFSMGLYFSRVLFSGLQKERS